MSYKSELSKLKMDTQHFCKDHGITSPLKLAIVVDYWPVLHYRLLKVCQGTRNPLKVFLKIILLLLKPFVEGLSGCRIYIDTHIGGGLLLHQSSGVVIAPGVTLGENCILFSGACVVYKANFGGTASPVIGDNVKLMVGSKVVGDVMVGDNAFIGANAVVLKDVPANSIAVGIPAKTTIRNDLLNQLK